MKADANDLLRRNTRPWRAVFVAYALLLTTATPWPALDIARGAGGGFQWPDKIIHTPAFAGLVRLLGGCRGVPRAWRGPLKPKCYAFI